MGNDPFREWIGRFISATVIVGYIIVAFLPKKQGFMTFLQIHRLSMTELIKIMYDRIAK